MAFSGIGPSFGLGLMLRIRGLPYVFADFAAPSAWTSGGVATIGGESYTWSNTIDMPDSAVVSASIDEFTGRLSGGGLDLRLRLPGTDRSQPSNPWLSLLQTDPFRSGGLAATLRTSLTATATSATVDTTTGWGATGTIYANHETIVYGGKTGTTFTSLTRGAYGSQAQYHPADFDGLVSSGSGGLWCDHPIVWKGRMATLWLVRGQYEPSTGVFTPDAATIEDSTVDLPIGLVLHQPTIDGPALRLKVEGLGLDALLERKVGLRLPRGVAGLTPEQIQTGGPRIRIDADRTTVAWRWLSHYQATDTHATDGSVGGITLQNAGGEIAAGWYTLEELAEYLTYTIWTAGDTPSWYTSRGQAILSTDSDGKVTVSVGAGNTSLSGFGTTTIVLELLVYGYSSFWRALGFTETTQGETESAGTGAWVTGITAGRKWPRLYLPQGSATSTVIQTWGWGSLIPDTSIGYVDEDSGNVPSLLRLGKAEVVAVTAYSLGALTITRAQLGTKAVEHYVEFDESEQYEVVQGLCFPNVSWPRMALYLMQGGSGVPGTNDPTYDQDWVGGGAMIHPDFVDGPSFTAAAQELGGERRDQWAIWEPTTIRDFLEPELLLAPAVLGPVSGKLTLTVLRPPLETDAISPAFALTVADQHPGAEGREYDTGESYVANALTIEGAVNQATGKAGHVVNAYHGNSVGTYGIQGQRRIRHAGITGVDALIGLGKDLADRYFRVHAFPRVLFRLPYALARAAWDVAIGQVGTVDDDLLPSMGVSGTASTATRGFTGVLARCVAKADRIPAMRETDAERSRIQFVSYKRDGSRRTTWAPSAYVSAITGPGSDQLVCKDHWLSAAAASLIDAQHFDSTRSGASAVITVHAIGDYANRVNRVVSAVTIAGADASYITTTAAVALTPPLIVEFRGYTFVTETQRRYAYQSDQIAGPTGYSGVPYVWV